MFFLNPTYIMYMLPGLVLTLIAQWWVKSTYRKWSQRRNGAGVSGAEAAHRLLGFAGMRDVKLENVEGQLTDHYDPGRALCAYLQAWPRSNRWLRLPSLPTKSVTRFRTRHSTCR